MIRHMGSPLQGYEQMVECLDLLLRRGILHRYQGIAEEVHLAIYRDPELKRKQYGLAEMREALHRHLYS